MATLKLCIQGMAGHADELRVQEALRSEPGVLGAIASREDACAEIEYEDDEVALDRLVAVVRQLGFPVELGG